MSPTLRAIALGLACTSAALSGCRSVATTERMRQEVVYDVQEGQYDRAVAKLNDLYDCNLVGEPDEEGGKAQSQQELTEKNRLLWHMERGQIDIQRKDAATATRHLRAAGELVDERRTVSVTREIGTYVGNDNSREFAGKGYEHTFVDFQAAMLHLSLAQQLDGRWSPFPAVPEDKTRADRYGAAYAAVRRMLLDTIAQHQYNKESFRYFDDPFANLAAALVAMAQPSDLRQRDDLRFAWQYAYKACQAYAAQAKVLGAAAEFRYEIQGIPDLAVRVLAAAGNAYDKGVLADALKEFAIAANDPRVASPLTPPGHGAVIVLNQAGIVTPTNELELMVMVGVPWGGPDVTPAEQARGITKVEVQAGFTKFWAKGPNAKVAEGWGAVMAAGSEIAKIFGELQPGVTMGFGIPAHRQDAPVPAPATVTIGGAAATAQVVSDLDAYARATLKDEQPGIVTKTVTRAFAKQVAAQVASKAVEQGVGGNYGKALGWASAISSSAAATASESADTRHWTLLPDRVEGAVVTVKAGVAQPVTLATADGTIDLGSVTVGEGQIIIIPARSFSPRQPNPYTDKK